MSTLLISGATSPIGQYLIPLLTPYPTLLLSRHTPQRPPTPNQQWLSHNLHSEQVLTLPSSIQVLIHIAPIWLLPNLLKQLPKPYPKHIIAISSTSQFTKYNSNSAYERKTVQALIHGETFLKDFAAQHNLVWTIIRPTLVYAKKLDKNITVIAQFIYRFKCFPLVGAGRGLRQPIHAEDIAFACVSLLNNPCTYNKTYNLSGGETLTYKNMVIRIFEALKQKPMFIPIPITIMKSTIYFLSLFPRFNHLTPTMIDRMNEDLVFDTKEAQQDFDFKPRSFQPLT
jgi:nucleoside-diphosphate-sugar epimerase